jgi:hypothetical protein
MPLLPAGEDAGAAVTRLHAMLREEGRDPHAFGLDVRIRSAGGPAEWISAARHWRALGATHICLNSATRGTPPLRQLDTAIAMKRALDDVLTS